MASVTFEEWCEENNSQLLKEWCFSKNIGKPKDYAPFSNKKVWWKCSQGHEWYAVIANRTRSGAGCPYCAGNLSIKGKTDLETTDPELLEEWDYEKNDVHPHELSHGSGKKVWWKCERGHSWLAPVYSRTNQNTGCPYCAGNLPIRGETDLESLRPDLAKHWNIEKNGELKPYDVTPHSTRMVWWICPKGHEWRQSVVSHSVTGGCPVCSGRKVIEGINDLLTTEPGIAKEWNYSKNGNLKPSDVTCMSNRNVWWICEYGHEWSATIDHRTSGNGCPYCANKKTMKGFNDLATIRPDIVQTWNYEKNGSKKPSDYTDHSGAVVWWICEYGHEWRSSIDKRIQAKGCPVCQSELKTSFGEKAISYYVSKIVDVKENYKIPGTKRLEIDIFVESLKIGIEYDGSYWHKDVNRDCKKNEICASFGIKLIRLRENGCPAIDNCISIPVSQNDNKSLDSAIRKVLCVINEELVTNKKIDVNVDRDESIILGMKSSMIKERSLEAEYPLLFKEVHPTKNGQLDPKFLSAQSNRKIWWICPKGHEWQAVICNRVKGKGCPYCSGKKPIKGINDLQTKNKTLTLEWSPRNTIKPDEVLEFSNKKVWWICSKGHEWQATVASRSSGSGCPYCCGNKVIAGYNDLQTTRPDLAKEWHYDKNGDLKPSMISKTSRMKIWWICPNGHEWQATAYSRNQGKDCPYCSKRRKDAI